jgi:hypothetical protein
VNPQKTPSQSYIDAFAELAAHSAPKCGTCRAAYACCTAEQCETVRDFAQDTFGIALNDAIGNSNLPFLGAKGCVVPPHLRPLCAVHVCGQHLKDDDWSEKYWELRERAGDLLESEISSI